MQFSSLVSRRMALAAVILATALFAPRLASQGSSAAYVVYTPEGQRSLPFRTANGVDVVTLESVAAIFGLTLTEDALVGGLTVRGRGQAILLIPGQSFASIGPGRIVSLPGSVQRERGGWQVPIDFLRQALGPSMNLRIEVRRASHVVLVGDVQLPHITGRFERQGTGGRLAFEIQPAAPHRVAREGNRLVVRFDAVAIDLAAVTGLAPELATAVRADGTSMIIELGSALASYRVPDSDDSRLTIELLAAGAPAPPAPAPLPTRPQGQAPDVPAVDVNPPGSLRTIVIDPGHGGEDVGVRGQGGATEKDYVLRLARRLKATIEGRFGLRVLLTRDGDDNVPLDRRTSLANNNKADLFISLHANASVSPEARGAQVLSLNLDDYRGRSDAAVASDLPVPVIGGGSRSIDLVPWDVAQLPFAARSAVLSSILARQLSERGVPLYRRPLARLPLRTLVGANMPAVLLEVGFLSTRADETALARDDRSGATIEAVVATIAEVRLGVPAATSRGAAR